MRSVLVNDKVLYLLCWWWGEGNRAHSARFPSPHHLIYISNAMSFRPKGEIS